MADIILTIKHPAPNGRMKSTRHEQEDLAEDYSMDDVQMLSTVVVPDLMQAFTVVVAEALDAWNIPLSAFYVKLEENVARFESDRRKARQSK